MHGCSTWGRAWRMQLPQILSQPGRSVDVQGHVRCVEAHLSRRADDAHHACTAT